jgi:hypothetical protein
MQRSVWVVWGNLTVNFKLLRLHREGRVQRGRDGCWTLEGNGHGVRLNGDCEDLSLGFGFDLDLILSGNHCGCDGSDICAGRRADEKTG